jgi:electron transfer flavoprotein beta subunit
MKILVCVKWVWDPLAVPQVSSVAELLDPKSPLRFQISRYDEYALEEALRIGECYAGSQVDAITVGPAASSGVLTRAMSLGAHHGAIILSSPQESSDAATVASRIAAYARPKAYDLIFTGVMSEDLMQGQVGPMLAAFLSISCATAVIKLEMSSENKSVIAERELEGGVFESFELSLPAVLTIQSGINVPRYPALSNKLRAMKYPFEQIDGSALGPSVNRQEWVSLSRPQRSRSGRILEGSVRGKAQELVNILRKRVVLT